MICLVTGKIGSGKTLHCLQRIVDHIAKGHTVYTNIRLDPERLAALIRRKYRRVMRPEQYVYVDLVEGSKWQEKIKWGAADGSSPVLCVWDEIHLFFNARDWAKTQKLHSEMLSFLSQSRKACVDILFIAQAAATLEKQFRLQCEWEFYCRKLSEIPIPLLGALPLNRMLLVQRDCETDKAISRKVIPYNTQLYPVYDTRAFLDASMREAAENVERVERHKLEKVPYVSKSTSYALAASFAICAYLFFK